MWNFLEGTARALSVLSLSLALAVKLPPSTYGFAAAGPRFAARVWVSHSAVLRTGGDTDFGQAVDRASDGSVGAADRPDLACGLGSRYLASIHIATARSCGQVGKATALSLIFALLWFVPTHASGTGDEPDPNPGATFDAKPSAGASGQNDSRRKVATRWPIR